MIVAVRVHGQGIVWWMMHVAAVTAMIGCATMRAFDAARQLAALAAFASVMVLVLR